MGRRARALADEVECLFAGTTDGGRRVGLEWELVPYRTCPDLAEPVRVAEMQAVLDGIPDVGFEPGGQVELHPGPEDTAASAVAVLRQRERDVRRALATHGVHLAAVGLDPWHRVDRIGLQVPGHRYRAMDRRFRRIGPAGRRFMRQAAGLQVCVDLRPGADGARQWQAANAAAPVLAAMFANSRVCEGRRLPTDAGRTAVCLATDPARMAYGVLGRSPSAVGEYVRFAAAAPPLARRYAGSSGAADHLSTLFPVVRPRGRYLELRALDSLPGSRLAEAVTMTAALLGVPGADGDVLAALEAQDACDLWRRAAGPGLGDPVLAGLARALSVIAARAAADLEPVGAVGAVQ